MRCILVVQVIYLAVSDWLEKRELEKLVAEEQAMARKAEAKQESAPRKKAVVARATPKGFGKKSAKEESDEE